jgi:hypothetical protein
LGSDLSRCGFVEVLIETCESELRGKRIVRHRR